MPVCRRRFKNLNPTIEYMIHRMPLQPADLHRLLSLGIQNARAFAEYRSGTHAPAAMPEYIRRKNGSRRAGEVVSKYLSNELRNVDLSRTSFNAGSVVAEEAPRGGFQGQRRRQRRIDIGKV